MTVLLKAIVAGRLVVISALVVACRHQAAPVVASVSASKSKPREFCSPVLRSPSMPDSVVASFRRAYGEMRLASVTTGRWGDTVWVHAGASKSPTSKTTALYESGAVAYSRDDSTHFRFFVITSAPPGGWARATDSVAASGAHFDYCAAAMRLVIPIGIYVPRELTGEESLSLWNASPWSGILLDSTRQR
jgi:hypothetical protein